VCGRLAFGQGGDSVLDFFQREAPGQRRVHLLRDPNWDVSLTLLLGFGGAGIVCIRGVQSRVEFCDELREVSLTGDCLFFCYELSQQCFLPSYTMKGEKYF